MSSSAKRGQGEAPPMNIFEVVNGEAQPVSYISHNVTGQSAVYVCVKMSVNPLATGAGVFPGDEENVIADGLKFASVSEF